MSLTRLLLLSAGRTWERFAERTRLRRLPAVPTALAVLALGLFVPLTATGQARPAQLSADLAADRLRRFARQLEAPPASGPRGELYTTRPAFFWPAHPGATHYVFTLFDADGNAVIRDDAVRDTFLLLRPPGALAAGRSYRFLVAAVDGEGRRVPHVEQAFRVRPLPEDLRTLQSQVALELEPPQAEYVMAGYFADRQSVHDVIAAVASWKTRSERANELRAGGPATWIQDAAGSRR